MAKLLHSQTGLKIIQNSKNGFVVATLHYTADPRKRAPTWKKEAAAGLKKALAEREFEISYDSMMGEKIFPEIKARQNEIVLHDGPFAFNDWPRSLPCWAGLDYGARNPSAFHIYTVVDGVLYAIWELYEPCRDIRAFIEKMKACPYWDQIRYIAHDPSMNSLTQRDMKTGGMTTVASQFVSLGVTRLLAGSTDEQAWFVQMQKHWCGEEVTFKIMSCCPMLIEEFGAATYVSMSERQLETQNFREAMVDKKNHGLDACKYVMNSSLPLKPRKVTLPNTAAKFGFGSIGSAPSKRPTRDKEWMFLQ